MRVKVKVRVRVKVGASVQGGMAPHSRRRMLLHDLLWHLTPTKARCSSKVNGHSGCEESSSRTCRATSASSRGTPVENLGGQKVAESVATFGGGELEPPRRWRGAPVAGRPSGWASLWECRAARSRQARAEEARGASWGAAEGGTLSVLAHDPTH